MRRALLASLALAIMAGFGGAALVAAQTDNALPVNKKCPMSGRAVNLQQTLTHEGETIAFCCGDCKANFSQNPAEHASKIQRLTVNTKCPMSGRDINPAQTLTHEKERIAFCCGDCKANFEQDPAQHLAKVVRTPVNAKCPVSGRDVNPRQVASHQGIPVGFCCANCKGRFERDPAPHLSKIRYDAQ
jgi:YHS domain-containing protein